MTMPSSFPAWVTPATAPTARNSRYSPPQAVRETRLLLRGVLLFFQAGRALRALLVLRLILTALVADDALPAGLVRQIAMLLVVTAKAAVALSVSEFCAIECSIAVSATRSARSGSAALAIWAGAVILRQFAKIAPNTLQ